MAEFRGFEAKEIQVILDKGNCKIAYGSDWDVYMKI